MRLQRIDVDRLPGGDARFALEGLSPGLNVVIGPNGSGKSSLCLAVQATLFDDVSAPPDSRLVTHWQRESPSETLRAELSDGVRWQRDGAEAEAPTLPAGHLAAVYRLGLRDLLAPDDPNDDELARQVKIQIAGGFDLASVGPSAPTARFAQREFQALQDAKSALARLLGERRRLARDEEDLASLRAELDAALQAARESERLARAESLARRRVALEAVERRIAVLGAPPRVLEAMNGLELDDFDRIEVGLADAAQALEQMGAGLREAEARRAATDLPNGPPDEATLETLTLRAVELRETDAAGIRHAEDLASATAERAQAERALAGDLLPASPAQIDGEAVDALTALVERQLALRERRLGVEARVGEASGDDLDPLAGELDRLRRAADWLRDWLASPASPRRLAPLLIVSLLALGALGGALGMGLHAGWLLVSAACAGGLCVALVGALRRAPGEARRREIEARWSETGLAPPPAFERDVVRGRLAELEKDLAALVRQQAAADEAQRLRGELAEIARREDGLHDEMEGLRERLGVSAGLSLGAVSDLVGRLRRWRDAAAREAGARGRLERTESVRASLVADVSQRAGRDFAPGVAAAEVQVFAQQLAGRSRSFRAEDDRARDLRARIDQQVRARQRLEAERSALLTRCGLETDADARALRAVLDGRRTQWLAFVALADERRSLRDAVEQLRAGLRDHPKLQTLSLSEAEDRVAAARARADAVAGLAHEIGEIEARVRAASEGNEVELAAAAVDSAQAALLKKREELAEALVARLMLDEIEREYAEQTRPEVLERASALFAQFTHHRYALGLDGRGEASRFHAIEAESRRGLPLAALSDGTRMQLLLAARLAFATSAEQGEPLPLFLDEALTASDPARFRAVTEALVELAASGRQIFYLTCKSADAELFAAVCRELDAPAPHVVDLGRERRIAAALDAPARLELARAAPVPAPAGLTAAQYGKRLLVPAVDPYAGADAVHLFHVLRDELTLLQRLLAEARVERIGQWRLLARSAAPARMLAREEIARIDEGARVAECLLAAWRIGRGLPVDRHVLEASGAVSEAFIEPLSDLAAALGGRANALLTALELREDPRAQRFRADKRAELAGHLADVGCLDVRPPLDDDALRARVLGDYFSSAAAARAALDDDDDSSAPLEIATVQAIVDALLAAIGESGAGNSIGETS